jgi:hypothetical protein
MHELFIGGMFCFFFETADYFGLADKTVIGISLKHCIQSETHFNPANRNVIGT